MLVRKCDLCNNPAEIDTKTIYGYRAYLCSACNQRYGIKAFNERLADTVVDNAINRHTIKITGKMREIPIEQSEDSIWK